MRRHGPIPAGSYLDFIRAQVPEAPMPPATPEGWDRRLSAVRERLTAALGRMPAEAADLAPEVLGTLVRDGYAIDRLTIQTRPGVRLTANLYRPDPAPPGRLPAVLNVHGHWALARVMPVLQSRCIGLAKLGYIALVVDAFGSGERAVEPRPGAYHGALIGGSLWPAGLSLMGAQVYDNRRAVDYLISRPDVDPDRLAVTGASGGGNQSLYAGATDDRLKAVVPVCGIGTLAAYIGASCCVCEVNPGAAKYATTGDFLAMMAPRALLVVNASDDSLQFSAGEARKSVEYAAGRYRSLGVPGKVRQVVVESAHDYNRPMREAMYGWLDLHLRGRGDGAPVAEPEIKTEEPADLRCYPDPAARPASIVTIPTLALSEGRARLAGLPRPADHKERWQADAGRMRGELRDRLSISADFLENPALMLPLRVTRERIRPSRLSVVPEPGLKLDGMIYVPRDDRWKGKALLLREDGMAAPDDPTLLGLVADGWCVLTVELRAQGQNRPERRPTSGVADHDAAEWGLWAGRPLLGQWTQDAMAWLGALTFVGLPAGMALDAQAEPRLRNIAVVGVGPFGLVGLLAAALRDEDVRAVGLIGGLASLVGRGPYSGLPLGLLAPNLLEVGDVAHLAALAAPRPLSIAGAVEPDATRADRARMEVAFEPTRAIYGLLGARERLALTDSGDVRSMVAGWGA